MNTFDHSALRPSETATVLSVQYFSQLDNGYSAGYTCNSSMCFTLACFAKPALLDRPAFADNGDFSYFETLVAPYGDTTDHTNQTAALASLGISTEWRTDACMQDVIDSIELRSLPVGIGILHKSAEPGPFDGGHMLTVVGVVRNKAKAVVAFIVHDPNGELDLVNGGYPSYGSGEYVRYSAARLQHRFECDFAGQYTPGPVGWARFLLPA